MDTTFDVDTVEVTLKLNEIVYDVLANIYYHKEMYGQDADGNRGEKRTFIDDIVLESVVHTGTEMEIVGELTDKEYDTLITMVEEIL